jgi:hypothetical protein
MINEHDDEVEGMDADVGKSDGEETVGRLKCRGSTVGAPTTKTTPSEF